MKLRPYQQDAVDATFDWFREGKDAPLIVLPTGTGKSLVAAEICKAAAIKHPSIRILVCAHVKELVKQNYSKLKIMWPGAPVGIYSAGLGRKEGNAQIIFCGIQSVHRKAKEIGHIDVMIIDEAHMSPRTGDGMWRKFEAELRAINPKMKKVGLTATAFRLDTGLIIQGDNPQFEGVCYDYGLVEAIQDGYLNEIISAPVETVLSTDGVGKRGGEFIAGQLQSAVDTDEQTAACCEEIIKLGQERKTWLIFSSGNQHAIHIHEYLRSRGLKGFVVTQENSKTQRDEAIQALLDGQCQYIVNNMILTTGFDCPHLDLIACMRPTQSAGLWVQMVGRGTRLSPGKENCMLLDFGGNLERHGPIDKITGKVYEEKETDGEAPMKVCPSCMELCHAAALMCHQCDFMFPPNELSIDKKASTEAALSYQEGQPKDTLVFGVKYARHKSKKPGNPDTLRVSYTTMVGVINEFVCFDHVSGFARKKADKWAMVDPATGEPPADVDNALEYDWTQPSKLVIVKDGKYWKVQERVFDDKIESLF